MADQPGSSQAAAPAAPAAGAAPSAAAAGGDRAALLGVGVKKSEDFSEWYTNVITRTEMIDYYDISGCYILRPWAYGIWEQIQAFFDAEIKKLGVQNSYFPLLVSERALQAESDFIEGFAPEVAWVTRAGQSNLNEPVAVRPTSETVMYPAFSRWVRSHRDLPMKLNQWCNVVRWEFKDPVPFLRSREFLWQEGHTAFASKPEADEEVLAILDLYRRVYEDVLAVPVVKGQKSEKEKFAGGLYTTTVEAFIPTNGRAIQGATSHCLGQNFARAFNIEFENEQGGKSLVWQNSWGLTTRTIGVMVMVHGDDKGLVLPPRAAPLQVVIIPIYQKGDQSALDNKAKELLEVLRAAGFRAQVDDRKLHKPGFKFNHWEMRGVPVRLELGPKDIEKNQTVAVRRDTGAKEPLPLADLVPRLRQLCDDIHNSMFQRAQAERDQHMVSITSWDQFVSTLDGKNTVLAPWCEEVACEEEIKKRSGAESKQREGAAAGGLTGAAKSLCIPLQQRELPSGSVCFCCGRPAKRWTLFGRSY